MIQFNLLPAVKLEYVKARRTKRLTMVMASLVTAGSLAILIVLLIAVQVVQKNNSKDLSSDIKKESSKLEGTSDLNKILTIQNQLASLTALHDKKPVATRLFNYIKQVTPANVGIASLNIDFDTQTMTLNGSSDSLSSVNRFVDTLKFTTYSAGESKGNAFKSVVLGGFGKDDKGSSYQISLKFDPAIFASNNEVVINVPTNKITTRSQTEKPESLFQPLSNQEGQ